MLKNIDIKNYRAIKHISLNNFANINIFTGAANTGKSSILEAVYFLCNINMDTLNNILKIRNFTDEKDMFSTLFYDYNIKNNIKISGFIDRIITCFILPRNNIVYDSLDNWLNLININYDDDLFCVSYSAFLDNNLKLQMQLNSNDFSSDFSLDYSAEYLASFSNYDTLKNNLAKILVNNSNKKLLNKYLNEFDSNIDDIMFIGNIISISYKYLSNAVNIKSMGKGFYTYLTILSAVLSGSKIIIIDEIENGIHFSLMKQIIDNIIKISKEKDIQFFISTHSKEFLEIFNNQIQKADIKIKLYNIYNKDNTINYIEYTKDQIYSMIYNQNEIRD